jgi:hypothetical protein
MSGRLKHRRARTLANIGVLLYAVFLVMTPFEHHDLLCEMKTPRHCPSCTSSLVGSNPDAPTTLDSSHLTDAGRAVPVPVPADGVVLSGRSAGRSPPKAR